jgi:hypothetical protein
MQLATSSALLEEFLSVWAFSFVCLGLLAILPLQHAPVEIIQILDSKKLSIWTLSSSK